MKASDVVAKVLTENDINFGFELIGGMIAHLVDSINQLGMTKLVSMHHEQGAAFAAGAVARATNHQQIGVALGTSGPGATNLITGIADCWLDSHPCLFLTGQVNTHELKGNRSIRQQGFQELDIISIVQNITKYSYQIKSVEELIPELQKAIEIAREGRPGPVLVDIPMDIQRAEIDESILNSLNINTNKCDEISARNCDVSVVIDAMKTSKKPLFLVGGGAVNSKSFQEWLSYLSQLSLPYVASLKGSEKTRAKDCYFGLIGAYGTRTANFAIQNCDLLVVVGSRLDVRQTGANVKSFAGQANIIQIDIDTGQLNNRVESNDILVLDCESYFNSFIHSEICINEEWSQWKNELKKHFSKTFVDEYSDWVISPFKLFNYLNIAFKDTSIQYVADVGNNQMWAAHNIRLSKDQIIHHSGGLGAMGFSIPASIGVCYASNKPVVVIVGDGGAHINMQELDVIAREQLPILVIVMNNNSLGMIRGFHEMYFESRNDSSYWGGYTSKFSKIGEAYGIESFVIKSLDEFLSYVVRFKTDPKPCLLEVIMDDARECRPRLEYGNSIDNQTPILNIEILK